MREKILKLLNEVVESNYTMEDIKYNPDIISDLGLDSLQIINFILLIEEELGIEIDFDDFDFDAISRFLTFCDYIESL